MIRFVRELRLIPIALIASACLLVLKTADLILDSGAFLGRDARTIGDNEMSIKRAIPDVEQGGGSQLSWAGQMFNFPDGRGAAPAGRSAPPAIDRSNAEIITGSVKSESGGGEGKPSEDQKKADAPKVPVNPKPTPNGRLIPIDGSGMPSGAERAILERLQERRQELDQRARELDIRESLIKAAEKRVEAQLVEVKQVEGKIAVETQKKDEAEATRLKGLVTMYENMKPRDAAKIFDRLDLSVLLEVASKINPRSMSEIMAQMSPDSAGKLTVELAERARDSKKSDGPGDLPKIQGQPTTP
jgi:flagellar motility protein MotE (MotC chaperone)